MCALYEISISMFIDRGRGGLLKHWCICIICPCMYGCFLKKIVVYLLQYCMALKPRVFICLQNNKYFSGDKKKLIPGLDYMDLLIS